MADNFRNKQWFKNMSQERKDEICKKFDIDEKTLRKCGRETDDGRIVINLLKIDHLLHHSLVRGNSKIVFGFSLEKMNHLRHLKYIFFFLLKLVILFFLNYMLRH